MSRLTERFENAIVYALRAHGDQRRKGTEIPYFAHVMAVTALVLEHGGDEDQAIAAILHDVVEDCGGLPRLDEIRQQYGADVAGMVEALSDAAPMPGEEKPPWRQRKQAYLDHLPDLPERVRLISACDKLHNAGAILEDLRVVGLSVFDRFKGGRDGTLWYYRGLADTFDRMGPASVTRRLSAVVTDIEKMCAKASS